MPGLTIEGLTGGSATGSLMDYFVSGARLGGDDTFENPRTEYTMPTSAIDAMTAPSENGRDEWGPWLRDVLRMGAGYAIQRDAARNGITPPVVSDATGVASGQAATMQASREPSVNLRTIMLMAIGGGLVYFALRKG